MLGVMIDCVVTSTVPVPSALKVRVPCEMPVNCEMTVEAVGEVAAFGVRSALKPLLELRQTTGPLNA